MKLTIGETVLLGETRYQVHNLLGRGAVSDVYLATMAQAPDVDVVIKLIREDEALNPRNVAGLQREAEALDILNRAEDSQWSYLDGPVARLQRAQETALDRRVVAMLDSGEQPPGHPFVVQEKAPRPFERFAVQNRSDEQRMLDVALAVGEVIALAHQHDLALTDFEPHTKWDRICLRWLDEDAADRFELKIIDWNVTGGSEDAPQDLFYFGLHLYHFFFGHHLTLSQDERPPANLSVVTPGWDQITEGSRQILQRLLHRDASRRYPQASALVADLTWWLETLRIADAPNGLARLQDRLWQVKPQGRDDRVAAVADLALDLDPLAEMRQAFELWRQQAQDGLQKEIWLPIASARSSLITGAYAKAAKEFQQQMGSLPKESEPARLARLFVRLAGAGERLKQLHHGQDVRRTPAWEALTRAVGALTERRWRPAQSALLEATRHQPEASAWQPVTDLLDLAQAGLLVEEAHDLVARAAPRLADADRPDWAQVEREQIALLEQAVEQLEDAHRLAPLEPDWEEYLQNEQVRLKLRQSLLVRYEDADNLAAEGLAALERGRRDETIEDHAAASRDFGAAAEKLRAALGELEAILTQDAAQPRARLFQGRWQPRLQEAEAHFQTASQRAETIQKARQAQEKAQALIAQRAYGEALRYARQAADLRLDWEVAQETLAHAQAAARLERQARGYQETAQQYIQIRNLDDAGRLVQQTLKWNGKPLRDLPGGEGLDQFVGDQSFQLHTDLVQTLKAQQDLIRQIREVHEAIQSDLAQGDYTAVIGHVDRLEKVLQAHDLALSEEETAWRGQAQKRLDALRQVEGADIRFLTFDQIRAAHEKLSGDPSERAGRLRQQLGDAWRRGVEELTDLKAAGDHLREGSRLFQGLAAADGLTGMLELVETGLNVVRKLTIGERAFPVWLDDREAGATLRRLDSNLATLTGGGIWPTLQEQARVWRDRLIGYLESYGKEQMQRAFEHSRNNQFAPALEIAQRLWDVAPENLRPLMWNEVEDYVAALQARAQVAQGLDVLVGRLAAGGRSFREGADEAQRAADRLLDHSDVPVQALRDLVADLKQAAAMEQALQDVPTPDTYATLIHTRRRLAEEPLTALRSRSELAEKIEQLQGRLRHRSDETAGQLREALRQAIQDWEEQPTADPDPLLRLYWQTRWWKIVSGRPLDETAQVQGLARTVLKQAASDFTHMQTARDLKRVAQILGHLRRLNTWLVRVPKSVESEVQAGGRSGDTPLVVHLPPLPQSQQYAASPNPLNSEALDRFAGYVIYLRELGDRPMTAASSVGAEQGEPGLEAEHSGITLTSSAVSEAAADSVAPSLEPENGVSAAAFDVKDVARIQALAEEIRERLSVLRDKVWPALNLSAWPEDAVPNKLDQEAVQHITLATALVGAHERLDAEGDAMGGLAVLDREIEAQGHLEKLDEFTLWLLAPQRQGLKSAFAGLRRALIAAIGDQVAEILEQPPDVAQRRLRDEVLQVPQTTWVAEAAYQAILEGVDSRAMAEMEAGRRDEARALWRVIVEATQSWHSERSWWEKFKSWVKIS